MTALSACWRCHARAWTGPVYTTNPDDPECIPVLIWTCLACGNERLTLPDWAVAQDARDDALIKKWSVPVGLVCLAIFALAFVDCGRQAGWF